MIVSGSLYLSNCDNLKSLGDLKEVKDNLNLWNCNNLISLGKLKKVNEDLICNKELEDLGDLEYVGKRLRLIYCKNIKSLDDLEYIGESLNLEYCANLKSLGKLKEVGRRIYLNGSGITKEYVKENYPHLLSKCIWS